MQLRVLFLLSMLAAKLISNYMLNNTKFDKGWITLLLGPLTGLLVISGHVAPSNSGAVVEEFNTLAGAVITIITVVAALHHQIELEKIKQPTTQISS